MKRYLIPLGAFVLGTSLIAGIYFGLLTWAQGWDSSISLFTYNRWIIVPIWIAFGIQAALYSILRFRLFVPTTSTDHTSVVMGTSSATSTAAMVACCLHHVTDVLPILSLSAAATFLTRYQRPFMLVGLSMEIIGIAIMLVVLYHKQQKLQPVQKFNSVLETK